METLMRDDLFINRNSNPSSSGNKGARIQGRGCGSSLVIGSIFGILVGLATFALGYPTSTAIFAGAGTLLAIMVLHVATTLLYFLFMAGMGLLGLLFAVFFISKSKPKR
jgi:hypothetical protein